MIKERRIAWGLAVLVVSIFYLAAVPMDAVSAEGATTMKEAYPGLASGILESAKLVEMDKGLLLKSDDYELRESFAEKILDQMDPEMRTELRKNLFFLLEEEATKGLVKQDAEAMGISADEGSEKMLKEYVDRLTKGLAVTEKEAKAFYDTNKEMIGGMPFEDAKGMIEGFLLRQKKEETLDAHVRGLGKRTDIRLNRAWVKKQAALVKDNPVDRARMSGKPTMVEFGATGCAPCDLMQPILEKLKKKYQDRLNVVFVHVRKLRILSARFGIRVIPVQVFFDERGKEVFRNQGFFPEKEILKQLKKLGVE